MYVLNDSLDAAYSLDKLSSVWARHTYSINSGVNGIEAHLLNKMPSVWASPFTQQFIESVVLANTLNKLPSQWDTRLFNQEFIE